MIETLGSLALQAGHDLGELRSDSLENPRTPLSRVFDAEPSWTGKSVSEISSLQISAVWGCIRILAGAIARTPLNTYRRVDGTGKHLAPDHYLYALLKQSANPFMSAFRFKRLMQVWVLLWGNAYARIEMNGRGQITALWPLRPDRMRVTQNGNDLIYTYQLANDQPETYSSTEIFHLRGLEVDGCMGLSPISQARQSLGLALAAEEFGSRFFSNNGRPGMVLKHPGKLSDLARRNLVEGWEAMHKGLQGSHRMGVLEEGMEIQEISIPLEDAQFLVTRKFQISEIARWYGVPLHKLAELDRATFSNIEHQGLEFVQDSLGDWFANWEQEVEHTLLSDRERQTILVGYDPSNLLKGDLQSTAMALATLRQNGFINTDEGREKIGENAIGAEAGGQKYVIQLNMQDLAHVGTEKDPNVAAIDPADTVDTTGVSQERNEHLEVLAQAMTRTADTVRELASVTNRELPRVEVAAPAINVTSPPVTVNLTQPSSNGRKVQSIRRDENGRMSGIVTTTIAADLTELRSVKTVQRDENGRIVGVLEVEEPNEETR